MIGRRTPAIYRLDDGEPPDRVTESLVWLIAAAPQVAELQTEPRYELMALVVFKNGLIDLVPAKFLEVISWSDDDLALTMSLPPEPDRDKKGHILHGNHTSCDLIQDDNVTAIRRPGRKA